MTKFRHADASQNGIDHCGSLIRALHIAMLLAVLFSIRVFAAGQPLASLPKALFSDDSNAAPLRDQTFTSTPAIRRRTATIHLDALTGGNSLTDGHTMAAETIELNLFSDTRLVALFERVDP